MPLILRHKRNAVAATVPAPASLVVGELAINTADGKLFTKRDNGVVVEIGAATGGAGTTNSASTEVDFGIVNEYAISTVAATWVTLASNISLTITPNLLDHDIEDALIEELTCTYGNIVAGVSFEVHVFAPNETHGRYIIKAIGA